MKPKIIDMIELNNLAALKDHPQSPSPLPAAGDRVYVKDHSVVGQGGGGIFVWRTEAEFASGIYAINNGGTIVQLEYAGAPVTTGRWVRDYDGYINIAFFGGFGLGLDYTSALQKAIDFAKLNSSINAKVKGATVFIPNGSYQLTNIILRHGVSILGESISDTLLYPTPGTDNTYMFEIEAGPVWINVSNLNLVGIHVGTSTYSNRGAFHFRAANPSSGQQHGGLWNSRFSNIQISGFKYHGIYLEGGAATSNYLLPNQFTIFENVRVFKNSDYAYALKITGQQGQLTFVNCEFDGFKTSTTVAGKEVITSASKGPNVLIKNETEFISAVLSFINCTFQYSDYGINIEYAENITIDNCWFEQLGVAITVTSAATIPSNSINILNNRFVNAAGYGSIQASPMTAILKTGVCVNISNSTVNVNNNFAGVSELESPYLKADNYFIIASNNTNGGVSAHGNSFQDAILNKTFGLMQILSVTANTLNTKGSRLVFVNGNFSPSPIIKTIKSFLNAGEILMIRADQGSIVFDSTMNLSLLQSTLTLNNGEIATFVKIDNQIKDAQGNVLFYETYQLISVKKV